MDASNLLECQVDPILLRFSLFDSLLHLIGIDISSFGATLHSWSYPSPKKRQPSLHRWVLVVLVETGPCGRPILRSYIYIYIYILVFFCEVIPIISTTWWSKHGFVVAIEIISFLGSLQTFRDIEKSSQARFAVRCTHQPRKDLVLSFSAVEQSSKKWENMGEPAGCVPTIGDLTLRLYMYTICTSDILSTTRSDGHWRAQ